MDKLAFRTDLNHAHGYHGSRKDCCIWCGSEESESQECPRRKDEWAKMQEEKKKFQEDVRRLYKSLGRKNKALLRKICNKIDDDLLR